MFLLLLFTYLSKCVAQVPADNPSQSLPESLTHDSNHPVLPTPWVEDGVTHHDVYKLGVKGQYATIPLRTDGYDHLSTFCYSSVPLSIYQGDIFCRIPYTWCMEIYSGNIRFVEGYWNVLCNLHFFYKKLPKCFHSSLKLK